MRDYLEKPKRNYEVFPGNSSIYCKGRLITSNDRAAFWAAFVMIIGPAIIWIAFVGVPLWKVSPLFVLAHIPVVIMIETFHFLAGFTDPGIIPRSTPDPEYAEDNSKTTKEMIDPDGKKYTSTYCTTCHIWRPPHAHHCRDCNNCIDGFDHHCPWVGNDVGMRNYRYFVGFLWSIVAGTLYAGATAVYQIVHSGNDFFHGITQSPGAAVVFLYCIIIFITIIGLAGYHCKLIAAGQTTYESIKSIKLVNTGCCDNFKRFCCQPQAPSLLNLRGFVQSIPEIDSYHSGSLDKSKDLSSNTQSSESQ